MVTQEYIQNTIGMAYTQIILAGAEITHSFQRTDDGMDITLEQNTVSISGRILPSEHKIDCHIRVTSHWEIVDDQWVTYDHATTDYEKLLTRQANSSVPILLVLMCLSKENEWARLDYLHGELVIQGHCYYWEVDSDQPRDLPETKRRYFIPKDQLFTPKVVKNIFTDIAAKQSQKERGI